MQRCPTSLRSRFWMGASVVALCAMPLAAVAQTSTGGTAATGTSSAPQTLGEIVVTGQRASLRSAEKIKKNATQLVDSITATDIGALPDRSVVEAMQRIPGITITRTPDPQDTQRVSLEGVGVQVDGVGFVASEFDGRDAFSATNGRSLSFDDVPAELMAGVDVYKNPSADMIEGGQSIINLRTRLPFDQPGHLFAYDFSESYGDLTNAATPSGSVLMSDRWKTPIGEFGVLVDLSDSNYQSRTDTLSVDPYYALDASAGYAQVTPTTPSTDKVVYVPGGAGYRSLTFNRERQGIDVATQWKPTDDLQVTAQFIRSAAYSTENEHAVGIDPDPGYPSANSSDVFNSAGDFVSGTLASSPGGTTDNFSVLDDRYNTTHAVTSDYSLNVKWDPTAKLSFSADLQYIDSTTKSVDFTLFDLPNGINEGPLTLNLNGKIPYIGIQSNPALNNPANYFWDAAMDYHNANQGDEWAERADGTYTFDSDWLSDFRFGVRHTTQDVITRETTYNWGEVTYSWAGSGLALLNGTNTNAASAGTNTLPAALMPFNNFFGGGAHLPGNFYAAIGPFMTNYTAAAAAVVKAEGVGNCCGWTPFNGNYSDLVGDGDGAAGVNTQTQDTTAAYLMLDFKHDLNFEGSTIPVDGNFGVRIVNTDAHGTGLEQFTGCGSTDCSALPAAAQAFETANNSTISGGRSYTNALPALNLRFKLKPDLFLRFAAAESVVRPDFAQMQPTIQIEHANGYAYNGSACASTAPATGAPAGGFLPNCLYGQYPFTAYEGNPNLKPTRGFTYDFTTEWYFAQTGSLTGTVFYKDVYDFITDATTVRTFVNDGASEQVLVNQSVNEGHGTIKGFEIAYQQYYDFLPGFLKGVGAQANFTYVDSQGARNASPDPYNADVITGATTEKLPLEGLSPDSYNLAALYDHGPWSARLAYNWRSKYLMTPSGANLNIPVWAADYGQLDGSVFFTVDPRLKIGFQATNLTHSIYRTIVSYPTNTDNPGPTTNTWVDSDRRYVLVLRGQF